MIYSRISGFTSCFCCFHLFAVSPLPLSHSCLSGRNAPVDACGRQTGLLRPVLVCISMKGVLRLYEAYTTSYGHCLFFGYVRVVADGMFFIPAAATRFVSAASFFVFRGAVYSFPGFFEAIHFRMDFFCFSMLCIFRRLFCAECAKKKRNFLKFQEIWLIMIT